MVKTRVPMQVAPEFEKRIKELQNIIMKQQGKKISLRDLTDEIAISGTIEKIEIKLLKNKINGDIKLNFDRRRK